MKESQLITTLRDNEPECPGLDKQAIIARLLHESAPLNVSARGSTENLRIGLALAAAASLLAVAASGLAGVGHRRVTHTETMASVKPTTDEVGSSYADFELHDSIQASDALEAEIRASLASRPVGNTTDFRHLRSRIRASEALLLVASDPEFGQLVQPDDVIATYPGTPAAASLQLTITNH